MKRLIRRWRGGGEMDRGRQIFGSRMLWVCTTADISLTLPLARLFPAVLRIDLTGCELLGFFPLSLSLSLSLSSLFPLRRVNVSPLNFERDDEDYQIALGNNGRI